MQIQLTTDDLMHITDLLRDDLIIGQTAREEYPLDDDIERSMQKSKKVLLKLAKCAILQAYEPTNDTGRVESRNRLN